MIVLANHFIDSTTKIIISKRNVARYIIPKGITNNTFSPLKKSVHSKKINDNNGITVNRPQIRLRSFVLFEVLDLSCIFFHKYFKNYIVVCQIRFKTKN